MEVVFSNGKQPVAKTAMVAAVAVVILGLAAAANTSPENSGMLNQKYAKQKNKPIGTGNLLI